MSNEHQNIVIVIWLLILLGLLAVTGCGYDTDCANGCDRAVPVEPPAVEVPVPQTCTVQQTPSNETPVQIVVQPPEIVIEDTEPDIVVYECKAPKRRSHRHGEH